jgi:predicted nucleic acid-binding protein
LVKRYLDERGSALLRAAMTDTRRWAMSRVGYAETSRPISVASGSASEPLRRFTEDWRCFHIVDVDQPLIEHTARLAEQERLGALDALHLASALSIPSSEIVFATWDRALHVAAASHGLRVFPERIG